MTRQLRTALMCAASLLTARAAPAQELLINGGFEQPAVPAHTYSALESLPGWTMVGEAIIIRDVLGPAAEGNQYLQIDGVTLGPISQIVPTIPGRGYILRLAYSPRPGEADNRLVVLWNGSRLAELQRTGSGHTQTDWSREEFRCRAGGDTGVLTIRDPAIPDGRGGLIDDVSLIVDPHTERPQITPGTGEYHVDVSATLTCPWPGATIYYTTDGTVPTHDSPSTPSGGMVSIPRTGTILRTLSTTPGFLDSEVAEATYTLSAGPPVMTPDRGPTPAHVIITSATPDATIIYTTDASLPSPSHGSVYSEPLDLTGTVVLRAVAFRSGMLDSAVTRRVFRPPGVIHVRVDGNDEAIGASWEEALASPEAAFEVAVPGDQIWIATGTYEVPVPDFPAGVHVYGGFAGHETSPQQRDIAAHPSILDGEDNSVALIIPQGSSGNRLDGLTIVHLGYAWEFALINYGSTIIANCTFAENPWDGPTGIIYNEGPGSAIVNCTFRDLRIEYDSCIRNEAADLLVANCLFDSIDTRNYIFASGILSSGDDASISVVSCTFARRGGYDMALVPVDISSAPSGRISSIQNCILWDGGEASLRLRAPPGVPLPIARYNNLEFMVPGEGNFSLQPLFRDAPAGDFRLLQGSPCVDAGSALVLPPDVADLDADGDVTEPMPLDFAGNPRVFRDGLDLGALENQDQPPCPPVIQRQPAAVTRVLERHALELSVAVSGPQRSYQWFRDGAPMHDDARTRGSSTLHLTVSNASIVDTGRYQVVVSTPCGSVTSDEAIVRVSRDCGLRTGHALRFAGTDGAVRVPHLGLSFPTREVTVEFWARLDEDTWGAAFSIPRASAPAMYGVLDHWGISWVIDRNTYGDDCFYDAAQPTDGAWHHWALVASAGQGLMRIFEGGLPVAESHRMTPVSLGDVDLVIGNRDGWHGPEPFSGRLDEFRIWGVARTDQEIAANFRHTIDPATPGLFACYRFDEGSGSAAHDLTSGNDGVLEGAVAWEPQPPCCPADITDDQLVNSSDFFEFLTLFFADHLRADLNDDGAVNSQDFFDFLNAFFVGC